MWGGAFDRGVKVETAVRFRRPSTYVSTEGITKERELGQILVSIKSVKLAQDYLSKMNNYVRNENQNSEIEYQSINKLSISNRRFLYT